MTLERKEELLLQLGLNCKNVAEFTGYQRNKCYKIMKLCREEFNGRAGCMTDLITPSSLCKALGTTIEEELRLIAIAKKERSGTY